MLPPRRAVGVWIVGADRLGLLPVPATAVRSAVGTDTCMLDTVGVPDDGAIGC
jgi:hypothetical protein